MDEATAHFIYQICGHQSAPFYNGTMLFDQFSRLVDLLEKGPNTDEEWFLMQFIYIDRDYSNTVSKKELKMYLKNEENQNAEEVKASMKKIKPFFGTDNQIDFKEFQDLARNTNANKTFKSKDKITQKLLNTSNSIKKRYTGQKIKRLVKTAKKNAKTIETQKNKATKRINRFARK